MRDENIQMVLLDLQLFAEGAGGSAGSSGGSASSGAQTAAAGPSSGVKDGSAAVATEGAEDARGAAVRYGRKSQGQTTGSPTFAVEATQHEANMMRNAEGRDATADQGEQKADGDDRRAAYAKLKAEYQDLYDEETSRIVRERLRKTNGRLKEVSPILDQLAVRYGTEPGDLAALKAAIDGDKMYLSAKAEETGTTEEIQSELERYRTREATERREAREAEAVRRSTELTTQAKAVKEVYPSFNVQAEMRNPQFVKLMEAGLDMRTAYEVAHRKELDQARAQYVAGEAARRSAQTAEDNLAAHIRANGARPTENAARGAAPAQAKVDPSKFTKEQIDDYLRRAKTGERITF